MEEVGSVLVNTSFELLRFSVPTAEDLPALFAICSDPQVWLHKPSARHTDPAETKAQIDAWLDSWEQHGLGAWVVREKATARIVGYGGCSLIGENHWNLGYRLAVSAQGKGCATNIAKAAIAQAHQKRPGVPVVASILEHNAASARVASKIGLKLAYRGLEKGNSDPSSVRLVYSDRVLEFKQLAGIVAPDCRMYRP